MGKEKGKEDREQGATSRREIWREVKQKEGAGGLKGIATAATSAAAASAFGVDIRSKSGSEPTLAVASSTTFDPSSPYDQTQWSMLQVFWCENSRSKRDAGRSSGSSRGKDIGRYYMLFLVPKLEVEAFLESMNLFIEQQREASSRRSKRHLETRSPNLTAGAVDLLRRSTNNSPEPSRMYTQASAAFVRGGMPVAKLFSGSRKNMNTKSGASVDESSSAAGGGTETRLQKAKLRNLASVHVPKVIGGVSRMLSNDDRINVACALPYDSRAYNWQLEYSSSVHGLSWHTLHRCIAKTGANIVLIRTTEGEVLGGYASQNWRTNGEYIGTGECAVFHCKPGPFSMYAWTGRNSYFMMATDNMMAMGGGGDFAFQIDARFKGTTGTSETFGNRILLESGDREFHVFDIEVCVCFLFSHAES